MIRRVVDFALGNRLLVLGLALVLFVWGIISFHNLPIEAYPDVADNYVEIITQWPGISAEQIEQQVTIPLETAMNGIPQRRASALLFAFRTLRLETDLRRRSDNAWNRERVLERLGQVTLPTGRCTRKWAPTGAQSARSISSPCTAPIPNMTPMELKSIEDWVVEKNFKSVPDIVDVASFGGPTREYQVRVDPNKFIAYGLSLAQVEQQLDQQQRQRRRQLHSGRSAADQRPRSRPGRPVHDIEETVITDQERHAAARQGYCRCCAGSEDPPGPVRRAAPMA